MEDTALLLEQFMQIPTASKAWFLPRTTPTVMVLILSPNSALSIASNILPRRAMPHPVVGGAMHEPQ